MICVQTTIPTVYEAINYRSIDGIAKSSMGSNYAIY